MADWSSVWAQRKQDARVYICEMRLQRGGCARSTYVTESEILPAVCVVWEARIYERETRAQASCVRAEAGSVSVCACESRAGNGRSR